MCEIASNCLCVAALAMASGSSSGKGNTSLLTYREQIHHEKMGGRGALTSRKHPASQQTGQVSLAGRSLPLLSPWIFSNVEMMIFYNLYTGPSQNIRTS